MADIKKETDKKDLEIKDMSFQMNMLRQKLEEA